MNLSEPFIRRPVMTVVLTASVILFGVLCYRQLPVNDLPAVDYPVIQVQVGYPGASPDTMANNIATPLERQFMQITGLELVTSQEHPGAREPDAAVRPGQEHRRRGDRRADRDHARPPGSLPVDLPVAADVLQDESERPADHVRRADERLDHSGAALRLREHAGRPAHQHPAGREPRGRLRRQVGDPHQGGPRRDVGARASRSTTCRRPSAAAPAIPAPASSTASGTALLRPHGQLDSADAVQEPDRRLDATARRCTCATSPTSGTRSRTSASTCASGRGATTVPSATVVLAVYRQAGANAVEGGPEHPRPGAGDHGRAPGRGAHHARSTTARRRS